MADFFTDSFRLMKSIIFRSNTTEVFMPTFKRMEKALYGFISEEIMFPVDPEKGF